MKICIVSDSHDRADALTRAVSEAKEAGAQAVIHCGDLIGAQTIRRIFAVHYPDYGYAMACTGDRDLVCCGHSRQAGVRRVANVKGGESWLVNPGTIAGLAAPPTWALGDLAAMRFEVCAPA